MVLVVLAEGGDGVSNHGCRWFWLTVGMVFGCGGGIGGAGLDGV